MSARAATVVVAATLASFLSAYFLARGLHADPTSFGIVAAVLALSLGRRPASRDAAARVEWFALPLIGLAAAGVGYALRAAPLAGAAIFVTGMALSVWLRAFGATARRLGALLALPLIALLVVPPPRGANGALVSLALLVGVAWIALAWVRVLQALARATRFVEPEANAFDRDDVRDEPAKPAASAVDRRRRLSVPARQALQMGVALALAFLVGRRLFPEHWSWVVLTAFIVCSGNHGRGDVVHKSVLRVLGALAGTAGAMALVAVPHDGIGEGVAIFVALFVGVWLRERNYAYWAACITLVLALLQGVAPLASRLALAARLAGIVVGAVCGILASWFVVPIRTRDVVFRRLATALSALEATFASALDERPAHLRDVEASVARLVRIAPPLEWHFRLQRGTQARDHPAAWIATMRRCATLARTFEGDARAAVGRTRLARRALGQRVRGERSADGSIEGDDLAEALDSLRALLAREPGIK